MRSLIAVALALGIPSIAVAEEGSAALAASLIGNKNAIAYSPALKRIIRTTEFAAGPHYSLNIQAIKQDWRACSMDEDFQTDEGKDKFQLDLTKKPKPVDALIKKLGGGKYFGFTYVPWPKKAKRVAVTPAHFSLQLKKKQFIAAPMKGKKFKLTPKVRVPKGAGIFYPVGLHINLKQNLIVAAMTFEEGPGGTGGSCGDREIAYTIISIPKGLTSPAPPKTTPKKAKVKKK